VGVGAVPPGSLCDGTTKSEVGEFRPRLATGKDFREAEAEEHRGFDDERVFALADLGLTPDRLVVASALVAKQARGPHSPALAQWTTSESAD